MATSTPIRDRSAIEQLIKESIEFFSHEENQNKDAIEKTFIPYILNYSPSLSAGLILDLNIFTSRLSEHQQDYLTSVFENAKAAKLSSNILHETELFMFLKRFRHLRDLTITLDTDTEYVFPLDKFNWENVVISNNTKNMWMDSLVKILPNNNANILNFGLEGVYVSPEGNRILSNYRLIRLSLINIILHSEIDRDTLLNYIVKLGSLRKLTIVHLKKYTFKNYYDNFSSYFLRKLGSVFMNLISLNFTIEQDEPISNFNLMSLPDLNELCVHYTLEKDPRNIYALILEILKLEQLKALFIPKITFMEYFSIPHTLKAVGPSTRLALARRSFGMSLQIREKFNRPVDIKLFDYEKYCN